MKTEPPSLLPPKQFPAAMHVAPPPPPDHRPLWQRWMGWGGSFFVVSLLLHGLLLGGATVLVFQVVQGRKEKLKFTAPPPSAAPAAEYKVKMAKRIMAAAPAISKRITSTAANASIALPAMDLNSSSGPDVMASVMGGLGSSGLGGGSGGSAGMASMPVAGLTAFGFKGSSVVGGLKGKIYDLKQTKERQPTDIKNDGLLAQGMKGFTVSVQNQIKLFNEFFKTWDENLLEKYYQAKDTVMAYQVMVPGMASVMGPKSFGVEKEIPQASHWMVHYKGKVTAPRDGTFRFVGKADDMIAVRFDNQNVFLHTLQSFDKVTMDAFSPPPTQKKEDLGVNYGKWFSVSAGTTYPMEVAIAEMPGGYFTAQLYIEEKSPAKPYPHRTFPGATNYLAYPIFQLKKGLPPPERKAEMTISTNLKPEQQIKWKPTETMQELAPDPVIFQGK